MAEKLVIVGAGVAGVNAATKLVTVCLVRLGTGLQKS
jgi:NADH dehydrogenase FAD-containing subunit